MTPPAASRHIDDLVRLFAGNFANAEVSRFVMRTASHAIYNECNGQGSRDLIPLMLRCSVFDARHQIVASLFVGHRLGTMCAAAPHADFFLRLVADAFEKTIISESLSELASAAAASDDLSVQLANLPQGEIDVRFTGEIRRESYGEETFCYNLDSIVDKDVSRRAYAAWHTIVSR